VGRFLLPRAAYKPAYAPSAEAGSPRVFLLTAVAADSAAAPARLAAFLDHYAALGVAAQHTLVLAQSSGSGIGGESGALAVLQAVADGRSVFLDVWVGPLPPASAVAARWRALLGRHGRRGDWAFVFDADELVQLPPGGLLPRLARQAAALGYDGFLALRTEETRPGGARDGAAQLCAVGPRGCSGAPPRVPLLVGALGAASLSRLRPLLDVGFDDGQGAAASSGAPYPVPLALRHASWGNRADTAAEAAARADALAACVGGDQPQAAAARERARLLALDGGWLTRGACPALACAAVQGAAAGTADSPLASALGFAAGDRRVAVVTSVWEHVDGVSKTLQTVSAQLLGARSDTHVLLLTPDVGGGSLRPRALAAAAAAAAARIPGLAVVAIPSLPAPGRPDYRWAPPLPRRAAAELELFAPDAVHAAAPDFLGHSVVAWARAHGVCSLCTYHTAFPTYLQYYGVGFAQPLVSAFMASFYSRCDYVAVPTHAAADDLAAAGVPRSKMGFFPRGVNGSLYSPSLRSDAWRRDVAGAAAGELVVLWVARLVREKGLDTFAATLQQLWREGGAPPFRVVVAGTGPDMGWLRYRLPEGPGGAAAPPVLYLGHSKGHSLATVLASADVFFFPSRTEVFPNNLAESMASGLAVLADDVGVVRALVAHNVTGILVPPERRGRGGGGVGAHADALRLLLSDEGLRRRLGTAAARSTAGLSWSRAVGALVRGYDACAARKREERGAPAEPQPDVVSESGALTSEGALIWRIGANLTGRYRRKPGLTI